MRNDHELVFGTRSSRLAMWQTQHVAQLLTARHPDIRVSHQEIATKGDANLESPIPEIGGKGVFTQELEDGLRSGDIDIAVHSLKDLPVEEPQGITIGACIAREDPRDAFVAVGYGRLADLPPGSRIGTCSLRRRAQVLAVRPDLSIADLRGNVPTRLQRLRSGYYDAVILALAGLKRLGFDDMVSEVFAPSLLMPAPGQGAIAVQVRADDARIRAIVAPLDHLPTRLATTAERAVLHALGAGCHAPVAALATVDQSGISLAGLIASPDGTRVIRSHIRGAHADIGSALDLGRSLASRLNAEGAAHILAALAGNTAA